MTIATVFFAAAQTGQAICGTAKYWAPIAALLIAVLAWRRLRRAARWLHNLQARSDQRRFHAWPDPDFEETEQAIEDLLVCRRLYRDDPIADQQRNTGTLNPRRKEQP
ncbi:hypothetical protein AB0M57_04390 [Streptomyces sp. NPDC051597]|uniref:hypothetical protein n=1 Tax=Streptomyces sp. NPDC051597 TaxID=3155049 RepID=UPI00343FDCFE